MALHGRARRPVLRQLLRMMADLFKADLPEKPRKRGRSPTGCGRDARRGGRPGAPDRRGRCADPDDPLGLARLDDLWGPPGTGKTTVARLLAGDTDLPSNRSRRSSRGSPTSRGCSRRRAWAAKAARRCFPSTRSIASTARSRILPSRHGRRHRHPGRCHHGKSVLRTQCRAAVAGAGSGVHAWRG